jgi:hypothetical protein
VISPIADSVTPVHLELVVQDAGDPRRCFDEAAEGGEGEVDNFAGRRLVPCSVLVLVV